MAALERERFTSPVQLHRLERLVEERVALGEVHAEREISDFEVSGADAQVEAALGDPVQRRRRLGQHEGVAVGNDAEVGHQRQLAGDGRRGRQRHEWVEALVPACGQPGGARGGVLGQCEPVPSGGLRRGGDLGDRAGSSRSRSLPFASG